MPEEKEIISVDKDRIIRCAWCGSAESDYWQHHKIYCSAACTEAALLPEPGSSGASLKTCAIILTLTGWAYLFPVFGIIIGNMLLAVEGAALSIVLSLLVYLYYERAIRSAAQTRVELPKDSQRHDYVRRDELEEVVAAITCPLCGADVNPASTDSRGLYHCEFCGANVKLPAWAE